jgi:cytochrome c peroxidase
MKRDGFSEVVCASFRWFRVGIWFLFLSFLIGCSENYPQVSHPLDNEPNAAKIELGRRLFFDTRLSENRSISCASCHIPEKAFTDYEKLAKGIHGNKALRNTPTLVNVAFQPHFMFDGELKTLEMQAVVPITDENEMGIKDLANLVNRLASDSEYHRLAKEGFNKPFDAWVLTRSLAAFQRTLVAWNSEFDEYYFTKKKMNERAMRGWKIFSEKLYCTSCHPAPFFTTFEVVDNGFEDTLDGGRFRVSWDKRDFGTFKVPTLRNITKTYPYMHNGELATLVDVLEFYSRGGDRTTNQSPIVKPFTLSKEEKMDLHAFFDALTTK